MQEQVQGDAGPTKANVYFGDTLETMTQIICKVRNVIA